MIQWTRYHQQVVGGLGLGYTAHAVLDNDRVRSLLVIETLACGAPESRFGC
jgi:hypothetical protein